MGLQELNFAIFQENWPGEFISDLPQKKRAKQEEMMSRRTQSPAHVHMCVCVWGV